MFSMLDQIMDIVYTETIREEEGGTYGEGHRLIYRPSTTHGYSYLDSIPTRKTKNV